MLSELLSGGRIGHDNNCAVVVILLRCRFARSQNNFGLDHWGRGCWLHVIWVTGEMAEHGVRQSVRLQTILQFVTLNKIGQ